MESAAGTITLEEALRVLAKSERARDELLSSLGTEAVEMFVRGTIEGDLGYEIECFFQDQIDAGSDTVYEDKLPNGYLVGINRYEGVYYVWSVDYWDFGYFLSEESAYEFISMNW
jgi:hypothetical protein